MTFYARLAQGEFETPLGFASRIAHANGFGPLRVFCAVLAFDAHAIRAGDPTEIERLASHAEVDPFRLGRFGFLPAAKGRKAMYGAEMIKASMHSKSPLRYCPHCICNDIEKSLERPSASAYLRAHWALNFVTACEIHCVELVSAAPNGQLDFGRYIELHRDEIEKARASSRALAVTEGDLYFIRRVLGIEQTPSSLDPFPFISAFEMAEALGFLGTEKSRSGISAVHRSKMRQAGFKIAKSGVDGIMALFDSRLPKTYRAGSDVYGGMTSPASMMSIVRRNVDHPAFAELSMRLREHAAVHLGLSEGREYLGKPIGDRTRISVAKAAFEHKVSAAGVVDKLIETGLVGPDAVNMHPAKVIVSTEAAGPVIADFGKRINAEEACDVLGVDHVLLHQLCDEGLFRRTEQKYFRTPTLFRRYPLVDLLEKVHTNAPIGVPSDYYVGVALASATAKCPISQIIAFVAEGKLTAVRSPSDTAGLLSMLVDPDEVRQVLLSTNYTHKFDRAILASTRLSSALVESGLLRHPKGSDGNAPMLEHFHPISFAELRLDYARLSTLAKIMEMDAQTVRARLDAAAISPALEGEPQCCYYRLRDLEGII